MYERGYLLCVPFVLYPILEFLERSKNFKIKKKNTKSILLTQSFYLLGTMRLGQSSRARLGDPSPESPRQPWSKRSLSTSRNARVYFHGK